MKPALAGILILFGTARAMAAAPLPDIAAFEETAEGFLHRGAGFEILVRLDGLVVKAVGSPELQISYAPPAGRFEGITPLDDGSHYRAIRQGPLLWIASATGVLWSWIGEHPVARWTMTGATTPVVDGDGAAFASAAGGVRLVSRGSRFRVLGDGVDIDLGPDPGELVVSSKAPEAPASAGCPGTINFDGGAGTGLWTTATNWDLDRLPEPLDDVCIGPGRSVFILSGAQNVQSLMVAAGSSLTVAGGTLKLEALSRADGNFALSSGTLTGAGDLDVYGALTWNGGTMSGTSTTRAHGNLTLGGTAGKTLNQRFLVSNATATWSGTGPIAISEFSSITNNGTWNATGDGQITSLAPGGPFINVGTLRKSAGSGTSSLAVQVNSTGTVDAQSGTLSIDGGGISSGIFTGSSAGTLRFNVFNFHFLTSTSSVIAPNVTFSLGTVFVRGLFAPSSRTTFASDGRPHFYPESSLLTLGTDVTMTGGIPFFESGETISIPAFTFSAGTLDGSDSIQVTDSFTWTGGGLSTTGVVEVSGPMAIHDTSLHAIYSGTLRTAGAVTWTDTPTLRLDGNSLIENYGAWDLQGSGMITTQGAGGTFSNYSSFKKSAGNPTTITPSFRNLGSLEVTAGVLSFNTQFVQLGGTTTQNGGSLAGPAPLQIQSGTLRGTGTMTASIVNGDTVAPGLSPGILKTSTTYTQLSTGRLTIEIGGTTPGTGHDRLEVGGAATLDGTLDVELVDGFMPAAGNGFAILSAGARTGTFATTNLPALPAPLAWGVLYISSNVQLNVGTSSGRIPGDLADEPPITVEKSGVSVTLAWANGCFATDAEVYEGALGSFTSHVPKLCSSGGATQWTFVPEAGDRYFLVVPTGGVTEGSYGYGPGGAERPVSVSGCWPQLVASCP